MIIVGGSAAALEYQAEHIIGGQISLQMNFLALIERLFGQEEAERVEALLHSPKK